MEYGNAVLANTLVYLIFVLPFFFIFWVLGRNYWAARRIQPIPRASWAHVRHDLAYSMITILLIGVADIWNIYMEELGYSLLYYDVQKYGWAWLLASSLIILVLDDAVAYWAHRIMHHPALYPFFHKVHHYSTEPTPFTSFAFHPSEAIVQNLLYYILPFFMPIHFGVMLFWQFFSLLNNILAHLGYELYPKSWTKIPLLKWKTVSTHHNLHHAYFNGNYALYFTWWDKLMGTELPNYEAMHAAIFERSHVSASPLMFAQPSTHYKTDCEPLTAQIALHTNGNVYEFECNALQTILESALAAGVPFPHQCKRGTCGKCRVLCESGDVSQTDSLALPPHARQKGYVLACQARPVGQTVQLKL